MVGLITPIKIKDQLFYFGELNVQEYKIILKCLLNDPLDSYNLLYNLNSILTRITNLTQTDILNLNLLEYLELLINIRISSIGNKLFAVYEDKDKTTKLEINLSQTLKQINSAKSEHTFLKYKNEEIEIIFDIPTISNVINNNLIFVKEIKTKDTTITDINEALLNTLPAKYINVINNHTEKIKKQIGKFYFYDSPIKIFSINLSLDLTTYIHLVKLLFNENLTSIYDNLFYLSKICNLNSNFLENCTYGEFKIFVKKAEEVLRKKIQPASQETNLNEPQYSPANIDSFYTPPDVTPSEFTSM